MSATRCYEKAAALCPDYALARENRERTRRLLLARGESSAPSNDNPSVPKRIARRVRESRKIVTFADEAEPGRSLIADPFAAAAAQRNNPASLVQHQPGPLGSIVEAADDHDLDHLHELDDLIDDEDDDSRPWAVFPCGCFRSAATSFSISLCH